MKKKFSFISDPNGEKNGSIVVDKAKRKNLDLGARLVCLLMPAAAKAAVRPSL